MDVIGLIVGGLNNELEFIVPNDERVASKPAFLQPSRLHTMYFRVSST